MRLLKSVLYGGAERKRGLGGQFGSPFCTSPIRQALTLNGEVAPMHLAPTSALWKVPSFEKVQDATVPATTP